VLRNVGGVPIRVRDVAEVALGRELRTGAATDNGREVVLGTVFMLIGENSRAVSQAVDKQMAAINRSLPPGVRRHRLRPHHAGRQGHRTVKKNLLEGAVLVIAILFLFLGNIRAALITAMVIPLSMLFTFTAWCLQGQRQPDEPGRAGLRHHRRRRGGHRRELRAPPGPCAGHAGRR
jgi:cobalt-zinc-cadmium resistance protein CzcA